MRKLLTLAALVAAATLPLPASANDNTAAACLAAIDVGESYVYVERERGEAPSEEAVQTALKAHTLAREAWVNNHIALKGTYRSIFEAFHHAWKDPIRSLDVAAWCISNAPRESGS